MWSPRPSDAELRIYRASVRKSSFVGVYCSVFGDKAIASPVVPSGFKMRLRDLLRAEATITTVGSVSSVGFQGGGTSNLLLARLDVTTSRYANCDLDDVRVYARNLTKGEIRLLASQPGIGLRQEQHRQTFYQTNTRAQNHSLISNMF